MLRRLYAVAKMTSSNENSFHVTALLWEESTGHRGLPLTKASDAKLWCFVWSAPEQMVEQIIETPLIWDAITFMMTQLLEFKMKQKRIRKTPTEDELIRRIWYFPYV